ncbi:MAG: hypothetical protein ACM3P1_11560 [Candidatus Saccharibacteria bacterium]
MALINENNGSSLSGLVGRVVIVKTKWGSYMRSAPQYSKSSWTDSQKIHRLRFKMVSEFCLKFRETVIPQIWKDPNERASGYALFLKANMPAFSSQGELTDPALVKLSTGVLEFPNGLQLTLDQLMNGRLTVSWPDAGSGVRTRDELMVISTGEGYYSDIMNTGILRGQKGGSFGLPELKAAASHLYLFFGSKDRRSYSGSECFTLN